MSLFAVVLIVLVASCGLIVSWPEVVMVVAVLIATLVVVALKELLGASAFADSMPKL